MTDLSEGRNLTEVPQNLRAELIVTEDIRRELMATPATLEAQSLVIDSDTMLEIAIENMNACKAQAGRVGAMFDGFVGDAKRIIERAKILFSPRIADLKAAEGVYKEKIGAYQIEQRRLVDLENQRRQEEARRVQQEAEAKARQEQARAEEAARQKEAQARVEAEALAKAQAEAAAAAEAKRKAQEAGDKEAMRKAADEERRANEQARQRAAAEAKAREQAQAELDKGNAKAVEAQMQAAAATAAVPTATVAKVSGAQMRDKWGAELLPNTTEDQAKALIMEAICKGRMELLGVLELNLTAIRKQAESLKGAMSIPGFVAKNRPIVAGKNSK